MARMPRYVVYGVPARLVKQTARGRLFELSPVLPPTVLICLAAVVLKPRKGEAS